MSDDQLPEEYVPIKLRPVPRAPAPTVATTYAIGLRDGATLFGMTHGPTPDLRQMLEVVAADERSHIIRLNPDGTEDLLYCWRKTRTAGDSGRWVRVHEADLR